MTDYWCIPPRENASFVACMEDILDIYQMSYNKELPVICMDEKPYQLLDEVTPPLPMRPGNSLKIDSEYTREGTSSIFIFTEPLANWRHAHARQRRTKNDWAEEIDYLLTECYPNNEKVILVMDNLNTHAISSLYATFEPSRARELAKRLEIHYTPKHGSWLNIAEIELNVMTRQCLKCRLSDLETLNHELAFWEEDRNQNGGTVIWHFQKEDAREKLISLYPKIKQ